jgi:serine/threonine protein kinase
MTPEEREAWKAFLSNTDLGPYRTLECVGGGQFSLVFEAESAVSARSVALKVLLPGSSSDNTAEFQTEGQLLRRLGSCAGVVDLVETAQVNIDLKSELGVVLPVPISYHVLEMASGCLEEVIVNDDLRESLAWDERLWLWRGAVLGVHQMHLKGLAHRDLKSSNCLLFVKPKGLTIAKISDLGRSRDLGQPPRFPPSAYQEGRGDFRFAAPEFLWRQGAETREAHKAADLYGLGSLLFELATGVGLTHFSLGYGPDLVEQARRNAEGGVTIDLSSLRPQFEPALELIRQDLPRPIAKPVADLLEQLCHPDPAGRRGYQRQGRRTVAVDGLDWLLRRTDILIKIVRTQGASATMHQRSKAVAS